MVIGEDFTNGNEHDVQIMHKAENKKKTLLNVICLGRPRYHQEK